MGYNEQHSNITLVSTYSTAQEAFEYPVQYASILHVQKLSQFHSVNSTKHAFLGLLQLDLTYTCIYFT